MQSVYARVAVLHRYYPPHRVLGVVEFLHPATSTHRPSATSQHATTTREREGRTQGGDVSIDASSMHGVVSVGACRLLCALFVCCLLSHRSHCAVSAVLVVAHWTAKTVGKQHYHLPTPTK